MLGCLLVHLIHFLLPFRGIDMKYFDHWNVKECECIFTNNNHVILSGKELWIFQRDGTFVARHKAIRKAYRIVFLPEDKVLIHGGPDGLYHYISLLDGQIIWSLPRKDGNSISPNQFAVTLDGKSVYYVYHNGQNLCTDHIIPNKGICKTYVISHNRCAALHCYCDDHSRLSILQSVLYKNAEYLDKFGEYTHFQHGILKWSPIECVPVFEKQWLQKIRTDHVPCVCNDEYVLFDDFSVVSFETGRTIHLLENSPPLMRAPGGFSVTAHDHRRHLLTVCFTHSGSNVIIDYKERKIVSHYASVIPQLSNGCLIGDTFWSGTRNGIIVRPFPHWDEFPRKI